MKILLLGEFSGVHNVLAKRLREKGETVVLASDGDSYKGFKSDVSIAPFTKVKFVKHILNLFYILLNIRKFCGYDVIQTVSPFVFPYYYHWLRIPNFIVKRNGLFVYYACGTDPAFLESKDMFDYFPFDDENSLEYPDFDKNNKHKIYQWMLSKVDAIIPAMYGYGVAYQSHSKRLPPIALPCSVEHNIQPKKIGNTINILFGITRYDTKGAKFILDALKKLEAKYKEEIKVTIVKQLPFNEYKILLKENDILIDQCKSYSYGMNALVGMANGLVILSGAEDVAMKYLNIENAPILNIVPDADQIFSVLSELINNPSKLYELKAASQNFVKKYHDSGLIASRFLEVYANSKSTYHKVKR